MLLDRKIMRPRLDVIAKLLLAGYMRMPSRGEMLSQLPLQPHPLLAAGLVEMQLALELRPSGSSWRVGHKDSPSGLIRLLGCWITGA